MSRRLGTVHGSCSSPSFMWLCSGSSPPRIPLPLAGRTSQPSDTHGARPTTVPGRSRQWRGLAASVEPQAGMPRCSWRTRPRTQAWTSWAGLSREAWASSPSSRRVWRSRRTARVPKDLSEPSGPNRLVSSMSSGGGTVRIGSFSPSISAPFWKRDALANSGPRDNRLRWRPSGRGRGPGRASVAYCH
jgi:hypothetical protein